jgi:hypothetical protein
MDLGEFLMAVFDFLLSAGIFLLRLLVSLLGWLVQALANELGLTSAGAAGVILILLKALRGDFDDE